MGNRESEGGRVSWVGEDAAEDLVPLGLVHVRRDPICGLLPGCSADLAWRAMADRSRHSDVPSVYVG